MKNEGIVWYCKRTSKNGDKIEKFAKPVSYKLCFGRLTIQPASGYDNVTEFGENLGRTWNAIAQPYRYWHDLIKEGDRFYLDGATPDIPKNELEPEDGWGYDANARVTSIRPQNVAFRFILQKIE